jgi:hypothetical protein
MWCCVQWGIWGFGATFTLGASAVRRDNECGWFGEVGVSKGLDVRCMRE